MERVHAKIMKGAAWLTLTRVMLNLLGLLSTFVMARLLTPSDFGIVAIATAILAVASSLTDLSLGTALVQRPDVQEEHFHSVWTMSVLRSALVVSIIGLAAYPLADVYNEPRLGPVLLATGVVSALYGLVSPKLVMFTRHLVFWQEFATQVTTRVLVFVVSVASAVLLKNYWALIIGNMTGVVCAIVMSYAIAPYWPKISFGKFRELFSFSFWLSMGEMVNTLNWKFDQLVLGYLVGKAPLGVYTVADNLAGIPVREATSPIVKTLFPAFSRIAADAERLRQGYTRAQTLVCALAMPAGFGFALVAEPVVRLAMGEKWLAAIPIVQILSATFALQSLSSSLQPLAMAKGATKVLFGRDVRTFLIRIPFIVAGYMMGGLLGVVIGRAVSSFIGTVWNMALVASLSGISVARQFRDNGRTLAATAVMVILTLVAQRLVAAHFHVHALAALVSAVIVGASAYAGSLLLLWLLQGRPAGPEAETLAVVRRVLGASLAAPARLQMRRR